MNLLCGFFQNIWTKFYNACVRNISPSLKSTIGVGMIIGALIIFVFATKGSKKGEMIGNWTLFWISSIIFILGVVYLNL